MKKMKDEQMHKARIMTVPILLGLLVFLVFYIGYFFDQGVNYYGSFLSETTNVTDGSTKTYEGKTSLGDTTLRMTTLSRQARFLEIEAQGFKKEFIFERNQDIEGYRLFDGQNQLILEGKLQEDEGVFTVGETPVNFQEYTPEGDLVYNAENPDPIVIVLTAINHTSAYRGNFQVLFLGGLILVALLVDLIFPDFFFRFKNLKYKGDIEVPELYRKMQRISWLITPFILMLFLYFAL